MPHVIVKLWPGKSEQQKTRLAEAITKDAFHQWEGTSPGQWRVLQKNSHPTQVGAA